MKAGRATPPPPGPALPFVLPHFSEAALSSGLRLRAARWGKRPTVAVSILYPGAGSASDHAGLEGTAEITAETFLGGTANRTARQLAEAIDDLSAVVDVSIGFDSAVARLFVLEKDLEAGLHLFAEILSEAAFPEDEVEKGRRRQIDLLREQRTEPEFLARERLLDRLYPGHPYGRLAATEKGLGSLSRNDVSSFYRARYSFSRASVVLVGATEPDRLLAAAERTFGGLSAGNGVAHAPSTPPVIQSFTIHLVHRPGAVQTNLIFARPALRRVDTRLPAALVANQSLGGGPSSRLFHALREERGLTYGAYSSLSPRLSGGHFGASIDCRTEVTREATTGLLDLIRLYAEEGPSPDENQRAINYLCGSFALARETPGAIAQDETTRILHSLPEDEWLTWRDRVRSVTRDDAREAARSLFDPSTGVLTAVGDANAVRPVLEPLGETTLWDADGPRS